VPDAQVAAAQRDAATTIVWLTAAAIVLATGLAMWLSTTIARPIGKLAGRMDTLARQAEESSREERVGNTQSEFPIANETRQPACRFAETPDPQSEAGASRTPISLASPSPRPGVPASPRPLPPAARHPAEIARLERSFEQLLARLDDARRQLARSARLATLGQLAASVAHELRNPLSGIKMNARVLADELTRANIADRSLDLIIREIDRMDLFLGELLDLASPGLSGPIRAEPVQLAELADSVLSLLAGRCRHGSVEVIRQFADCRVRGDSQQIRQVMLNLMLNALDAMPHGGKMTVAVQPTAGAAGPVRFSVTDTGPGVQPTAGADIFDPFVTTKPGGTGLGLAISRQVISRHDGRIGYDTSPTGSMFWFELPAGE
jgi:signal transduction histidine kinase